MNHTSYINKVFSRPLILRAVLATVCLLPGLSALAQTGVGVSPPRVELTVQPGGEVTQTVMVDNPSQFGALDVHAYFSDAFLLPDGEVIYTEAGDNPRSTAPWTAVTPLTFELLPARNEAVRYTVSVPQGTEPGTYWSVLFFESRPPTVGAQPEGFGVTTVVRVGHIIYVTVGQPSLEGSIQGIRYDQTAAAGALRVMFQNSGEGLLRLNGRAEVRSTSGDLLQTLSVDGAASFPGAIHELVLPLNEELEAGDYVVLALLDYGEASVIAAEGRIEIP